MNKDYADILAEFNRPERIINVRPSELLCAVCYAGGCATPPAGADRIQAIINETKKDSWLHIRLVADLDIGCVRYQEIYGRSSPRDLSPNHQEREGDFATRMRDLSILRKLGLQPGDIRPAYELVRLLLWNVTSLDNICRFELKGKNGWEECPYAREGYFDNARGSKLMISQGISIGGVKDNPVYIFLAPRAEEEMAEAKRKSVEKIKNADRIFIRAAHLMCLVCLYGRGNNEPLKEDNLYEMRLKMEENPDIPVTLTVGTSCMACPPCPVYDRTRNLCYHGHSRAQLRDLMALRRLSLEPGATLPAREIYARLFERIEIAKEICGWGDMIDVTAEWKSCGDATKGYYEKVRKEGFLGVSAK